MILDQTKYFKGYIIQITLNRRVKSITIESWNADKDIFKNFRAKKYGWLREG